MTAGEVTNVITMLEDKATYKWARIAAELGSAEAQAHIGIQLIGDVTILLKGVTRDANEGLRWLNISAQHGCVNAFYYLSIAYMSMQNKVEGLKWAMLAKARKNVKACNMYFDKGSFDFAKFADLLSGGMTTAQIAEAQKLAHEWKPADPLDRLA
jgi:TPR repeat protein